MKDDFDMSEVEDMFDGFDEDTSNDSFSDDSFSDNDSDGMSIEDMNRRFDAQLQKYQEEHEEEIKRNMVNQMRKREEEFRAKVEKEERARRKKEERQRRELELKEKDPEAYQQMLKKRERKKEEERERRRRDKMERDAREIKTRKSHMSTIIVSVISLFFLYKLIASNIGGDWGFFDCFGGIILILILFRTYVNKRKQLKEAEILEEQYYEKYGESYEYTIQ